ncbi:hypothetical protein GCK72_026025 [Caenorhabditis remanei]|uniref:Piwi domain-containing protein n=1 Tax=Caenorhabditis remanei TaxID=31234 RepID=A0A6A5G3P8_CAERE|nr:hypothetical protein GCK72_026025 [Caenorhabditis remanei]KAF1749557.1 hypothetical protein GCK72_026025 [Caenorhabditis remanei]
MSSSIKGNPIRKFYSYKLVLLNLDKSSYRGAVFNQSSAKNLRQEPPRTQDMKFETAVKLPRQQNTKKNIVNKINIKLEGLNYKMGSSMLHPQKFGGGFVFVKRPCDVYGPVLQKIIHQIIKQAQSRRNGELKQILIYINGITEGQYGMINEKYSMFIGNNHRRRFQNLFCFLIFFQ